MGNKICEINVKDIYRDGGAAPNDSFINIPTKHLKNYLFRAGEVYTLRMIGREAISEAYRLTNAELSAVEKGAKKTINARKISTKKTLERLINFILDKWGID